MLPIPYPPRLHLCIIRSLLLHVVLLLSLFLAIGQGQMVLDGSLGRRGPLRGPDYVIPAEVGRIRGGNLFHSFQQFNVGTRESATFTGPASIANILSRVTGGQQSSIDGLLRSEIPGANL
jgi:haemagglutination activity domain